MKPAKVQSHGAFTQEMLPFMDPLFTYAMYLTGERDQAQDLQDPDRVFHGQRMRNGWKNAGLPWTYDVDSARMVLPPAQ